MRPATACCLALGLAFLAFLPPVAAADPDLGKLRQTLPASGIAALIEPRDLRLAAAVAEQAHWSVHCLVRTPAQRDELLAQVHAKGLGGRVSVLDWSGTRLPYAPHLITALVIDRDAAGTTGPSAEELRRVTAPYGAILTGNHGTWTTEMVTLPPAMDAWPQWRYGAGRTRSSSDQLVGASDVLQWEAGRAHEEAARLAVDGLLITGTTDVPRGKPTIFRAYNAFNGALAWQREAMIVAHDQEWKLTADWYWGEREGFLATAHAGRLFLATHPVSVIDLTTGGDAGKLGVEGKVARIWGDGDALIAVGTDALSVLDAKTLALRWSQAVRPYDLVSDGTGTLCYLDIAKTPYDLVGRSLKDGRETYRLSLADWWVADYQPTWQNFNPKGKTLPPIRIVMCAQGRLLLRSAKDSGWMLGLDPANGKTLWTHDARTLIQFDKAGKPIADAKPITLAGSDNWVLVGTRLWYPLDRAASERKASLDLLTGKPGPRTKTGSVNDFCQLAIATARVALFKDNTWIDGIDAKDLVKQWVNPVGNNQCGTHVVPAYGRTFFGPKGCNCSVGGNHVRAAIDLAQAADPFLSGSAKAEHPVQAGTTPASTAEAATWPCFLGSPRRLAHVALPLSKPPTQRWSRSLKPAAGSQWLDLVAAGDAFTQPVATATTIVLADCEAGRVYALDRATGTERWSRSVGGRVAAPPSLAQGRCLVGSDDGWVTCLDLASGATCWRSRAAPGDRLYAMQGRIASTWPVLESILVGDAPELAGLAIAIAGRLDGDKAGSYTVAMDLADGRVRWSKRGRKGMPTLSPGGAIYAQVNARSRPDSTLTGPFLKPADGSEVKSLGDGVRMVYQSSQPAVSRLDHRLNVAPAAIRDDILYVCTDNEWKQGILACHSLGGPSTQRFGQTFGTTVAAKATWSKNQSEIGEVTCLFALGDGVLVASTQRKDKEQTAVLSVLAAADGAERWRINVPGPLVSQGLLADASGMITVGRDGTVTAFGP